MRSIGTAAFAAVVGLIAILGSSSGAFASPGCTSLNLGTVAGANYSSVAGFDAGDTITVSGGAFAAQIGANSVLIATSVNFNSTAAAALADAGNNSTLAALVISVSISGVDVTLGNPNTGTITCAAAPPATVTSISPTSGPVSGGTSVTITGTGFTGATAVNFGATVVTALTVNSATSITATSPAGTGTVDITVSTASGTSATSTADQFTYAAVPTIGSISPTSGPVAGGTTVTITGTGFSNTASVRFGATNATFAFISSTSMTATSPAGTGIVDVTVTTAGGTSATLAADQFTYIAAPTIGGLSPTSGPAAGGTTVTITGTGLSGTTAVKFGATNATFAVISSTSMTATSPAGTGIADVTVTTAGGTSATSAADQFTYIGAPTITSLSPAAGSIAGGTPVTITGTGFTGTTAVAFGATGATSFVVNSATQITATSPAGAGIVDVRITSPAGTSTTSAADQFSYVAGPAVTSISPTSGPVAGGTTVTVTGANFAGATAVTFGATAATAFTVNSATSITATSPAGTGTVDVVVTTALATSPASAADRFTYIIATTNTALISSKNPSDFGQAVTFTATVTSSGGTPTGTVSFLDAGATIATAALSGGVASFTTSTLAKGSHSITASYSGAGSTGSLSAAVNQIVNIPADSIKLRAMQALAAPVAAQMSGQAIAGAIESAISEGFAGDGGPLVAPSASGMRFNFSADDDSRSAETPPRAQDPFGFASGSSPSTGSGPGTQAYASTSNNNSRVGGAFDALAYAGPTKAPPQIVHEKEWLAWADVRGATLDHWSNGAFGTGPSTAALYGAQVNVTAGLTRRLTPRFLIGVLGGYETFDYRSDALQGRLKGDGWTVGSYLGWKITEAIRFDTGLTYSGIGYDGTAGTASGTFAGNRWLFTTGVTGTYKYAGFQIEPSARVYALWEHENAYTDSLATAQDKRDFSTGRASAGAKFSYPIPWSSTALLVPYAELNADYYFNSDSANVVVATAGAIPATVVLDGWSARAAGGLAARFDNGAQIVVSGERGGIGGNVGLWTYKARGSIPFSAQ